MGQLGGIARLRSIQNNIVEITTAVFHSMKELIFQGNNGLQISAKSSLPQKELSVLHVNAYEVRGAVSVLNVHRRGLDELSSIELARRSSLRK